MPHPRFTTEEIGRLGEELYERVIRAQVETAENRGKMVVMDVETGEWEMGDDEAELDMAHRLHAKHPGAAVYAVRVGYLAAGKFGGSWAALAR